MRSSSFKYSSTLLHSPPYSVPTIASGFIERYKNEIQILVFKSKIAQLSLELFFFTCLLNLQPFFSSYCDLKSLQRDFNYLFGVNNECLRIDDVDKHLQGSKVTRSREVVE